MAETHQPAWTRDSDNFYYLDTGRDRLVASYEPGNNCVLIHYKIEGVVPDVKPEKIGHITQRRKSGLVRLGYSDGRISTEGDISGILTIRDYVDSTPGLPAELRKRFVEMLDECEGLKHDSTILF